jgi:hypothetical protein
MWALCHLLLRRLSVSHIDLNLLIDIFYYLLSIPHARDLLNKFHHDSQCLKLSFNIILENVLVEKKVEAPRTE